MFRKMVMGGLCLSAMLVCQSNAFAQTTASQQFNVFVAPVLSISAPPAVSINHDTTDANQVFPAQSWVAQCNNSLGAVVNFSTGTAFRNTVGATIYKRNAQLALGLASSDAGSGWAVTAASDVTNYAGADEVATVSAASSAPGSASFNLTVTFLDTDFSVLAAGTYTTTVTGTITAN